MPAPKHCARPTRAWPSTSPGRRPSSATRTASGIARPCAGLNSSWWWTPIRSSVSRRSITTSSRRLSRRPPAAPSRPRRFRSTRSRSPTDGTAFTVNVEGSPYRCTVVDATCRKAEAGPRTGEGRRRQDDSPRLSPDGQWEALIHNYNVAVRPAGARHRDAPQHRRLRRQRLSVVVDRLVARLEEDRRVPREARLSPPGALRRVVARGSAAAEALVARSTPSRATCSTSTSRCSSTSSRSASSSIDNALFPNAYDDVRARVAQGQPRLHVRVQPARPSGLSRHRGRRRDRRRARA